jgi:hypothetical protein
VVSSQKPLLKLGVPWVKNNCGTLTYFICTIYIVLSIEVTNLPVNTVRGGDNVAFVDDGRATAVSRIVLQRSLRRNGMESMLCACGITKFLQDFGAVNLRKEVI